MVACAHETTAHMDLHLAIDRQQLRDGHVVGDNAQAPVMAQLARNCAGGGAHRQHERAVVGDARSHCTGNAHLGLGVQRLALLVRHVLGSSARAHTAVKADDDARLSELLHVASHRLHRYTQTL
jgi:hypothetical protein